MRIYGEAFTRLFFDSDTFLFLSGESIPLPTKRLFYELVSSRYSAGRLHHFLSLILRVVDGNFAYRLITTVKKRHLRQIMEKCIFGPGTRVFVSPGRRRPSSSASTTAPVTLFHKESNDIVLPYLSQRVCEVSH